MFFNFEGIDGCGKSTQAQSFYNFLREDGVDAVYTCEPGIKLTDEYGDTIADMRELCFRSGFTPEIYLQSFFLDRAIHHHMIVEPALEAGRVVVSDRGLASTFAYQVAGQGVDSSLFDALVQASMKTTPDLVLWYDLDPQECRRRTKGDDHPWSPSDQDFYRRVRAGYRRLSEGEDPKITTSKIPVDVNQDAQAVFLQTLKVIHAGFGDKLAERGVNWSDVWG